jgi:hypothetical protein
MNHVSLTGPEGYRSEGHEGRRKKKKEEKGSSMSPQIYPVIKE